MATTRVVAAVCGAAAIAVAGCGARGLPPGGPAPGEVDIGYGTRAAEDVTGSVSTVSSDRLGRPGPLRIDELLRGRVPGLQIMPAPDGSFRLRIRGKDSLLYDQEPLVIVDGIQISSYALHTALAGLHPDEIRQVDVLKDVSSTSIFGSRGAGGVILITTTRR